jgi:AraC family transcriptional activator of pobA
MTSRVPAVRIVRLTAQGARAAAARESAGAGPAVALLSRGSGSLDRGPPLCALSSPSLVLLPSAARCPMRLDAGARAAMVLLESSFAHLMTAREPAFASLFSEARALPLERSGAELRNIESTVCALGRELGLAAAARLTAIEAHLQLLLTAALRVLERATSPGLPGASAAERSNQLVSEFLRLALAHGRQRWRLPDYARALNVSTAYLRATCVRVTGSPPVQLIHECLLREARHRLIATALPVSAIALELGFEDAAYFSRLFHAKSGLSPRQYRLSFR